MCMWAIIFFSFRLIHNLRFNLSMIIIIPWLHKLCKHSRMKSWFKKKLYKMLSVHVCNYKYVCEYFLNGSKFKNSLIAVMHLSKKAAFKYTCGEALGQPFLDILLLKLVKRISCYLLPRMGQNSPGSPCCYWRGSRGSRNIYCYYHETLSIH